MFGLMANRRAQAPAFEAGTLVARVHGGKQ
jgi:hypothetical protein